MRLKMLFFFVNIPICLQSPSINPLHTLSLFYSGVRIYKNYVFRFKKNYKHVSIHATKAFVRQQTHEKKNK